jgi:hypothetical protein
MPDAVRIYCPDRGAHRDSRTNTVLWYFPECKIAIISTSYAYMSMSQNVEKSVK